jgi:hypothetical protein
MCCICSLVADQAELDLVGGVLDHLAPALGGHEQRQSAGLAHRHGGLGIDLEEDPLDHDGGRPQLLHQRTQLRVQDQESLCQRRVRVGLDHPGRVGPQVSATFGPGHQAVAAAGQAGVDAQYEHAFAG